MAIESSASKLLGPLWQWLSPALRWFSAVPNQTWRNLVMFVGILLLSWMAAQALWLLLTPTPAWDRIAELSLDTSHAGATRPRPADGGADVNQLAALNLFGNGSKAARELLEDLPEAVETALPIHLIGIAHADDAVRARAIIHYGKSQQEQHKIGDRLKTGVNVTLERILRDRVIIRNQGRYESLFLYDDELAKRMRDRNERQQQDKTAVTPARLRTPEPSPSEAVQRPEAAASDKAARVLDRRNDQRAVEAAKQLHRTMLTEPAKLGQLAAVSPANLDGRAVGYRIDGSANADQLNALGLQTGDIVTHVNGAPITNASQALAVYQQLRDVTEGEVSILRNNVPMTIKLRLQ